MAFPQTSFNITYPILGLIFGQEGKPDIPVKDVSLEMIGDASNLQINIMQDGMMETRVQIGLNEKGEVVCKMWKPENWSKSTPDKVEVLYAVSAEDEAAQSTEDERDEDY